MSERIASVAIGHSCATALRCVSCEVRLALEPVYHCPQCGGILEVEYDYQAAAALTEGVLSREPAWMNALLPLSAAGRVSLGEGGTALLEAPELARELGLDRVLLKCEFNNPTGSFKDRPISIGVSKAIEFGRHGLVVASTGNAAASVAAYAARAGLPAVVLVPEDTSAEKVSQTLFYGARVVRVRGTFSASYQIALDLAQQRGFVNLSTTFLNPYTVEGNKQIAFELYTDLGGKTPDEIFVPVGAGPMLVGIANGYRDLRQLGRCRRVPGMIGVQAEGCCPIAEAYRQGAAEVTEEPHPRTIAKGIGDGLCGYAADGTHTLNAIRSSGGYAVAVSDQEILDAQRMLARNQGLFVEPTGAAGLAGLRKARAAGTVSGATAVVILSGHGLKDAVRGEPIEPPLVDADQQAVVAAIAGYENRRR